MADAARFMPTGTASGSRFARPVRLPVLTAALVALLALTMLGPLMTFSGLGMTGEGSPARQGAYVAVAALAMFGLRPLHDPSRLLVVPWPIVAALIWCLVTVTWAIDPGISIRRLVLTAIIIWSIFAIVPHVGYDRTLAIVRALLLAGVIAGYVAVLAFPQFGIHQADEVYDKALVGDWRGVFLHKNIAGAVAALTVLVFVFDRRTMPRAIQLGIVGVATFFLLRSGSRTSMGVCCAALAVGFVFLRYHFRYRALMLGLVCVIGLAIGIFLNILNDPLMRHLNDQSAFTGRTQIWDALVNYIGDHPFGSGFGSFWNIGPDSPIFEYGRDWVVTVGEGHNGFLDVLATIGIPGLAIVIASCVVWPLVRLFRSPAATGPRGALIFAIVIFCVSHNATESSLFDRDSIVEVSLMLALALLWAITDQPPRRGFPPGSRSAQVVPGRDRAGTPRK